MYIHLTHIFSVCCYTYEFVLPCRDITNSFRFGFSCSFFFSSFGGLSNNIYFGRVGIVHGSSLQDFFLLPPFIFLLLFQLSETFFGGFCFVVPFLSDSLSRVYVGLYLRGLFFSSSPGARCSVKNQRNVGQVAACHRKMQ